MSWPEIYYRTNVEGGLSLLDAMLAVGVRRRCSRRPRPCMGDPERVPITEDALLHATSAYGETKLAFERGWV
jgi:UDP-glucose 4-epimerase